MPAPASHSERRTRQLEPSNDLPRTLQRWRYNLVPDHLIGEILSKRWTDNAIPFLAMVVDGRRLRLGHSRLLQAWRRLSKSTRQLGEFSIVVTGMTVVMLAGGIDLSVGSIFALSAFAPSSSSSSSACRSGWPPRRARRPAPLFGAINGYLVGYLRLRAFLTTLVTCVVRPRPLRHPGRQLRRAIQLSDVTSEVWDFIGDGKVFGLSISVIARHRDRHRRPYRADALAARLAHPGGRRLAPLGAQCRHPRAPHRVHVLRDLRTSAPGSPASSSPAG